MAALRATCPLLPLTPECLIKTPIRENNNEEQTNAPRIRRHRARYRPRIRHARTLRLGRREEIRSRRQRYRNQARADRAAFRPRLALWRVGARRRGVFPDAERKGGING